MLQRRVKQLEAKLATLSAINGALQSSSTRTTSQGKTEELEKEFRERLTQLESKLHRAEDERNRLKIKVCEEWRCTGSPFPHILSTPSSSRSLLAPLYSYA